jgi:hypothetical protein
MEASLSRKRVFRSFLCRANRSSTRQISWITLINLRGGAHVSSIA